MTLRARDRLAFQHLDGLQNVMDGYADHDSGMTGFRSAYEDTRRRSVDQADVEGSNPFGPTTQHCLSGQDSCLFSAFELDKCGNFFAYFFR